MTPDMREKLKNLGFDKQALSKLEVYASMITKWNKAINLVAPSTLSQLWERHLLDSAQLWPIISEFEDTTIIDLGSGGGLPGIVLGIAGVKQITMVESDTRKCVFLREVSRETNLQNVSVINDRIEKTQLKAPIITARALAPLKQLVEWSSPLLQNEGKMVFLKGADVKNEINDLPKSLQDKIALKQSLTDRNAHIVIIGN